ncbi:hypothetical protein [Mesorhizobium sp. M1D.F.Ca.ET.043.01.1.1]|nr:hypothetical protein [Mesorhizobium sp. M1D.F.Ca.ET.043.01.1.1]AZO72165.1 hypothetical protein EJ067_14170 [Mesorhizobium sp. M1D.F.Ca.ET.043.01.1.1]
MQKYAPALYKNRLALAVAEMSEFNKPLVWKEVTIPQGSEVRMAYGADHHYAKIQGGKIVDASGEYSPSEWASKVAGGTSRNAWRDLWFRLPLTKDWVPAQTLRSKKGQETNA